MASQKVFLNPEAFLRDCFVLARKIYDSGYCPDVLLALWRGGAPVALVIHEFLVYKDLHPYHAVIKISSYRGIEDSAPPTIEHMDSILAMIQDGARVLVVDDILDTGVTLREISTRLAVRTDKIKIATLFYKPEKNQTDLVPDYCVTETDDWIVFPHELAGLSEDELKEKGGEIFPLLG